MIYILCGKSGSGKDYIMKKLIQYCGLSPIVSWTSRPMRDGETNGIEYKFCDKDTFLDMIKNQQLIEYREYHTLVDGISDIWFYGVAKEELNPYADFIVILDINGARNFMNYYGRENCRLIYVDADDEVRTQRAIERGSFNAIEWERRLKADESDFEIDNVTGLIHGEKLDYIFNNNFENGLTVQNVYDIMGL